jgi:hypothetical protein
MTQAIEEFLRNTWHPSEFMPGTAFQSGPAQPVWPDGDAKLAWTPALPAINPPDPNLFAAGTDSSLGGNYAQQSVWGLLAWLALSRDADLVDVWQRVTQPFIFADEEWDKVCKEASGSWVCTALSRRVEQLLIGCRELLATAIENGWRFVNLAPVVAGSTTHTLFWWGAVGSPTLEWVGCSIGSQPLSAYRSGAGSNPVGPRQPDSSKVIGIAVPRDDPLHAFGYCTTAGIWPSQVLVRLGGLYR